MKTLSLKDLQNLQLQHLKNSINLVASSSYNLAASKGELNEVWQLFTLPLEGEVGKRYYRGLNVANEIETRTKNAATRLFGFKYANVQPLSGSAANWGAYGVLNPGDVVLAPSLNTGGHLTHMSSISYTSKLFKPVYYDLDYESENGAIDLAQISRLALQHKPRMIICGYSAWPYLPDYAAFQEIAQSVNAWLLCDIAHVAGLIAAGKAKLPDANNVIVTTSTYKTLCGPKGGICLTNNSAAHALINRAIFPGLQGTNDVGQIYLKLQALEYACTSEFAGLMLKVTSNAKSLAGSLAKGGLKVQCKPGFTNTHMVLFKSDKPGFDQHLESAGIYVSALNDLIRLGTTTPTALGLDSHQFSKIGHLIAKIYHAYTPNEHNPQIEPYETALVKDIASNQNI